MKMNFRKVVFCIAFSPLLFANQAWGAVIIWDTPVNVDVNVPTQVSTAGTLIGAESVYASWAAGPDIVVNGVTFTDSPNISYFLNGAQPNGVLTGPNYQDILYWGAYVANSSAAANNGIYLSGLTPGQSYQLQVWTSYWTANFDTRFSTGIPDGAGDSHATNESPLLVLGVGGVPPQYILGTFTADASTQTVYYYGNNSYGVFGAIQVRAVPEPATVTLLALGGLAFVVRYRWRRLAALA